MKMFRKLRIVAPVLMLHMIVPTAHADAYADAREELIVAYQVRDFAAMQLAANQALQARPGYPGALFNLAYAKVLDDDQAGDNCLGLVFG